MAQILDNELQLYKRQIVDSLKSFGEIFGDNELLLGKYKDLIYSRNLFPKSEKTVLFYEIGITSSHSRKYFAVLNKRKLVIYNSKDFLNDFFDINNQIKNIKDSLCKVSDITVLFAKIASIYQYNNAPPWQIKFSN